MVTAIRYGNILRGMVTSERYITAISMVTYFRTYSKQFFG